ncbi:uncharacterized protein KY384_003052 [Bacidia gigantensis]|uniref:uncharacterized protein n=1 Tax=Bacidia gigantensis TaxID=2732470 RepID=UPI001D05A5AA|nr:uncharacterized protein KY384_003052 [Bacidia gigantensis]KAG8531423.1 hypothetical protein KY384_003052 [Bacidia gigantensis]
MDSGSVLSEDVLRSICKSLTVIFATAEKQHDNDGGRRDINQLLNNVLRTASSTTPTLFHSTAALNALCGILHKCSVSPSEHMKSLALSKEVWEASLDIFLTRSENHKTKPLRRLLETLTVLALMQSSGGDHAYSRAALSLCLRAIFEQEKDVSIKSSFQALDWFLRKRLIEAQCIFHALKTFYDEIRSDFDQISGFNESSDDEDKYFAQVVVFQTLTWVRYPDCAPAASRFLSQFIGTFGASGESHPLWFQPLAQFQKSNPDLFDSLEKYIYPMLLESKEQGVGLLQLINPHEISRTSDRDSLSENDLQVCLLAARAASKKVSARSNLVNARDAESFSLDLLDHASPVLRISALSTLLGEWTLSKAINREAVERLIDCISYFHQETDPKPRNEFIALMKKCCTRFRNVSMIRGSTTCSEPLPQDKITHPKPERESSLEDWYIEFIIKELRPTGTYHAHITALNVLRGYLEHYSVLDGPIASFCRLHTTFQDCRALLNTLTRVLLDLICNPFDDVREVAALLMEMLVTSELKCREPFHNSDPSLPYIGSTSSMVDSVLRAIPKARSLFLSTGRACHADGLARLLCLAFGARTSSCPPYDRCWMYQMLEADLDQDVQIAGADLLQAVQSAPLHGNIIAMRYGSIELGVWEVTNRTLELFQQRGTMLTRRSAGLPAIITGILAASCNDELFDEVLLDLLALADGPPADPNGTHASELSQVHALNCLKDIFNDSRFGSRTDGHVDNMLYLAAECLDSSIWAIRNSGLMLLKALLNRISGGTDTLSNCKPSSYRHTSNFVYEKFLNLPYIVLRLLSSTFLSPDQSNTLQAQKIFPALEIIQRFGVPHSHQHEVEAMLHHHLASPLWALREKAANACSAVVLYLALPTFAPVNIPNNTKRLVANLTYDCPEFLIQILPTLERALKPMLLENSCPITATAFLAGIADLQKCYDDIKTKPSKSYMGGVEAAFERLNIRLHKDKDLGERDTTDLTIPLFTVSLNRIQAFRCVRTPTSEVLAEEKHEATCFPSMPSHQLEYRDQLLRLGQSLARDFSQGKAEKDIRAKLMLWMRLVMVASCEIRISVHNGKGDFPSLHEIDVRLAAIHSIGEFVKSLVALVSDLTHSDLMLPLHLLIYDILADNDDEVRIAGAKVVQVILSCSHMTNPGTIKTNHCISPAAARKRFLKFILTTYRHSPVLFVEAIRRIKEEPSRMLVYDRLPLRLTTWDTEYFHATKSALDRYSKATGRKAALFEVEKSNLYFDWIEEGNSWIEGFLHLEPIMDDALNVGDWKYTLSIVHDIWPEYWIKELARLVEQHPDGVLGPTAQSETFTSFYRLLLANKASIQFIKIRNLLGESRTAPIKALEFMDVIHAVGEKADLHGLLMCLVREET